MFTYVSELLQCVSGQGFISMETYVLACVWQGRGSDNKMPGILIKDMREIQETLFYGVLHTETLSQ